MFARVLMVALVSALIWAVLVRTSDGASPERLYVVRSGDTLWSIAERSYGGDPREGVWRLSRRNHLDGALIRPGQRLVVPSG
jgi:nucleoid-associated protein YgaU